MRAIAKVEKPEEVEIEMSISMTLAAWKKLQSQLQETQSMASYPACDLFRAICKLTSQVEAQFEHEDKTKPVKIAA